MPIEMEMGEFFLFIDDGMFLVRSSCEVSNMSSGSNCGEEDDLCSEDNDELCHACGYLHI